MTDEPMEAIVKNMFAEHRKVLGANALVAGVILTFTFIDSMARAGLESDRNATGEDFVKWVNQFMQTPEPAEYRYDGTDVYLARCSMLHTMSAQRSSKAKKFIYHDGFPHRYRPDIDPGLVGISVPLLVDDFYMAVSRFLKDVRGRSDAKAVEARFVQMYRSVPFRGAT